MHAHVDEKLVACVEGAAVALAAGPVAREVLALALVYVRLLDVTHQLVLLSELETALVPLTRHSPSIILTHQLFLPDLRLIQEMGQGRH